MLAHHHLDSRRVLRILVLVWILLVILVLLPVRTHGQETLAPPMSSELAEDLSLVSPALMNGIAAEMMLFTCASLVFLVFKANSDRTADTSKAGR